MFRVLSVIGTRPEAIKMAPVIKELEKHPDYVHSVVCSTGQHREMLDQVLHLFQIVPHYDLHLMQANQSLAALTARLFTALDQVVEEARPDCILAQGDTTTVLAAALIAFYHHITFGHVEAGLRTGDKHQPFPEEINRRLADTTTDLYFAPTEAARQTLLHEGVREQAIYLTGNTVIDALLDVAAREYDWANSALAELPQAKRLVLITAHRRESFGEQFKQICLAIRDLAQEFQEDGLHFVYPVHLNPNVRQPVNELLADVPNISLLEPLDYLSLVQLMKQALVILTDSGGIQEEAPSLGVPVLVMRETTERPEGVAAGVSRLVGTQRAHIVQEARALLRNPLNLAAMTNKTNPYGDGKAAQRIVAALFENGFA